MANATRVATSCNIYTHTHLLCLTWISLDDCRWLIDAATVVMYVRQTMQLATTARVPFSFHVIAPGNLVVERRFRFFSFAADNTTTRSSCVSFFPPSVLLPAWVGGGVFFFMPFVTFDWRLVVESWSPTFVLAIVVVVVVGKRPASKIRYVRCGLEFYAADEFEIDMREFCFFFHALKLLSFFFLNFYFRFLCQVAVVVLSNSLK
jgi:hypothetical protein